jgi:ketosteroid isomerase-like protein
MPQDVVDQFVDAIRATDAGSLMELFAEDAVLHHPLSPIRPG